MLVTGVIPLLSLFHDPADLLPWLAQAVSSVTSQRYTLVQTQPYHSHRLIPKLAAALIWCTVRCLVTCNSLQAAAQSSSMESIRQIAVQLPEGLQRLQLHLFANGLVGWSPQEDPALGGSHITSSSEPDLRQHHGDLQTSSLGSHDMDDDQASETADVNDSDDHGHESSSDGDESSGTPNHASGMSDEEQIAEIHAFIVGDETENADFGETALMAATQLVSSLADSSEYLEPEVIESLERLNVQLHSIEGGLHLKIDEGHDTRSIYIYNDDVAAADTDDGEGEDDETHEQNDSDSDSDFSTAYSHGASSSQSSRGGGDSVTCPVCLQGYSSSARMAALSCRHHVCSCCFERLPRPKLCPICRGRIRSHMEVIL